MVPTLKYVEHESLYGARVAGHLKEGSHADDHKQRTDDTEDREASLPHGQELSGIRARRIADSTVALIEYARRDLHFGAVHIRIWLDQNPRHRRDDLPDLDLAAPGVSAPSAASRSGVRGNSRFSVESVPGTVCKWIKVASLVWTECSIP